MARREEFYNYKDWKKYVEKFNVDIISSRKRIIDRWVAIQIDTNEVIGVYEEYQSSNSGYGIYDPTGKSAWCKAIAVTTANKRPERERND